ncbi:hypothetical protein [Desulfosarcina sp.]|uniref:hypothetical protein n=1 Tax=Desulfosarcina sp. TaxID=2027861 RepID=UPI00397054D2
MAILLANPVLATVSAAFACNGRNCCCADDGGTATVTFRSIAPAQADCCRPTGAAPCRMSANSLPDAAPALVHTPDRQSMDTVLLLWGNGRTAADRMHLSPPGPGVTRVPASAAPPVYLRTCRLIC